MTEQTKMKPWFKLRGAEYSTDVNFFLQEQIAVWRSYPRSRYFSRLNGQYFCGEYNPKVWEIEDDDGKNIISKCKEIHSKLLKGEYGQGEFID